LRIDPENQLSSVSEERRAKSSAAQVFRASHRVLGNDQLSNTGATCCTSSNLRVVHNSPPRASSDAMLCDYLPMSGSGKYLREALLAFAGLASAILSLLGIGIFLWTVDPLHSSSNDLWTSILLCLGPILTAPAFLILIISLRWHRLVMWLLACASLTGTYLAMRVAVQRGTAWDAIRQPIVIFSFAIATLVEISYRLKPRSGRLPNRSVVPE
jgi:hypothetical protein